jgi:hypothetical protein
VLRRTQTGEQLPLSGDRAQEEEEERKTFHKQFEQIKSQKRAKTAETVFFRENRRFLWCSSAKLSRVSNRSKVSMVHRLQLQIWAGK